MREPATAALDALRRPLAGANALVDGAALLTADATIRADVPQAVWEDA